MRKIYGLVNSLFRKMGKHNDEKVTVEIREVKEDQVPKEIREQIEKKEKELREKEAQMWASFFFVKVFFLYVYYSSEYTKGYMKLPIYPSDNTF